MKRPIEAQLFGDMVAFIQRVQRDAEAVFSGRELSVAQFFILSTLARAGALMQADIASLLGVTAANVSQLVAKLVSAKLVRRSERGRAKLVSLTPKGRELVTALVPEHHAFLREQFRTLSAAERRSMRALMQRLLDATETDLDCGS
ncbi:MAG: MarR family transcriptional regulator [Myxococcota bacterium]